MENILVRTYFCRCSWPRTRFKTVRGDDGKRK